MEADLSTRLSWIAVDHWNTDNPHVHVLVRGVDQDGADLVISRDYISRGLRSRAEQLVAIELGPKPEREIRNALEQEITADRWTRLDREIRMAADEVGAIDLRRDAAGIPDPDVNSLMRGRLQYLERLGLATAAGPGEWMVGLEAERKLRDLGQRGDIIKTMHRAFTSRGAHRGIADYAIDDHGAVSAVIGRLCDHEAAEDQLR
jgi:type IV secretory pathway VirD2 relaxase